METGRPVETERRQEGCARARQIEHVAVDARRQELAARRVQSRRPACSTPTPCIVGGIYKHLETKPHVVGQRYQYIENRPTPAPPGAADRPYRRDRSADRQAKWRAPLTDHPIWSAMLATGGGLLFTGKHDRRVHRARRRHRQDAVAVPDRLAASTPADHLHAQRRQYVTVLSGIGGLCWNVGARAARTRCRRAARCGRSR